MKKNKGILGFLKELTTPTTDEKNTEKEKPTPKNKVDLNSEIELFCIEKLTDIFKKANFEGAIEKESSYKNNLSLKITDVGDDAGRLIGKNATTQRSLELFHLE